MLERPSEPVTREDLRLKLWPEGTFVDFDHGLNIVINKLRELLAIMRLIRDSLRRWHAADIALSLQWSSSQEKRPLKSLAVPSYLMRRTSRLIASTMITPLDHAFI